MIRITKIFSFETAHALYGYPGKCKNIHGHSYKLYVTVAGKPNPTEGEADFGMVMDFGDLKELVKQYIVDVWDHATLLYENGAHLSLGKQLQHEGHKVVFTAFNPTCENMLQYIAQTLQAQLPEQLTLSYLKLHETENSYGEWYSQDQ